MTISRGGALSLKSLNHISRLCGCLEQSVHFYQNILGFRPIVRPSSFNFNGAWLFNYGFGIHLLQVEEHEIPLRKLHIDLNVKHISFQNLALVEKKLTEMEISYARRRAEKWGLCVDQLFFHDPDGFMIEVCSFENLPMIPPPAGEWPAAGPGRLMEAGQLPPQAAAAEAADAATAAEEQCPDHVMLHCC